MYEHRDTEVILWAVKQPQSQQSESVGFEPPFSPQIRKKITLERDSKGWRKQGQQDLQRRLSLPHRSVEWCSQTAASLPQEHLRRLTQDLTQPLVVLTQVYHLTRDP